MKPRGTDDRTKLAISPDGRWLAGLAGTDVVVVDLRGDERQIWPAADISALALAPRTLWLLRGERLEAHRIATRQTVSVEVGRGVAALALATDDGVVATGGRSPVQIRVVRDQLLVQQAPADVDGAAFPLGGGRFLTGGAIHESGRHPCALRLDGSNGSIEGAWPVLAGRAIAVLVCGDAGSTLLTLRRDGALIHRVAVPPVHHLAIASETAEAFVAGTGGELLHVGLRLGAVITTARTTGRVDALACDGRGAIAALAHDGGLSVGSFAELVADIPAVAPAPVRADEPRATPIARLEPVAASADRVPEVALRIWRARPTETLDDAARASAVAEVRRAVLRHDAVLLEMLLHRSRNHGLLPRDVAGDDPLAHLAISDGDALALLASLARSGVALTGPEPFAGPLAVSREGLRAVLSGAAAAGVGLARLVHEFHLSDLQLDQLALALGPDLDLRIGRLCGFLNNDVTARRPLLGHLQLLGDGANDAVEMLLDDGILELGSESGSPRSAAIARVPELVATMLFEHLDRAPTPCPTWDELRWPEAAMARLRDMLARELHRAQADRLVVIEGLPGAGRLTAAILAARDAGVDVEVVAPLADAGLDKQQRQLDQALFRARLAGRILAVRSDGLLGREPSLSNRLAARAARLDVPCFVLGRVGEVTTIDARLTRVGVPRVGATERRRLWADMLARNEVSAAPETLDDCAARYATLTPGRICELAAELRFRASWRKCGRVDISDVRAGLREATADRMNGLARPHESGIRIDDLVLPDLVRARLDELVARLRHRQRVLSEWRFADKAHGGYGVSALFAGPPGTGKTAGAAAIANELEIDLYVVNVANIMSKWVGETEQNLARVFDEAEVSNVALLFDEADSLFGKRSSEQRGASDRFANLTVNYLLTRMESFSGLAILTTNLETALDEAFQRRITARVRFPASDEQQRRQLWQHLLPRGVSYAHDVDLVALSTAFHLEGAHIQRALTRAAFRSAARGDSACTLDQVDLEWAAAAEYDDMGRLAHLAS